MVRESEMERKFARYIVSTIREPDIIPYLPYDEFLRRYPIEYEANVGSGSYGAVRRSKGKYAIKQFKPDPKLKDLIQELNIYAANAHPCIVRPVAWSVDDVIGHLAMPLGENLYNVFDTIPIERVIFDTLSAIEFLNSRGIAHRDIKPYNMVYHEGRVKIIDMGLARKCELNNEDKQYYCNGRAHTENYMDPEYSWGQLNNIKFEIYSLGASYLDLLIPNENDEYVNEKVKFGELYSYTIQSDSIGWFMNAAKQFQENRPTIHQLMDIAETKLIPIIQDSASANSLDKIFEGYVGTAFKEAPIMSVCYDKEYVQAILLWLVGIACDDAKYTAEVLFLALHLIHRTYSAITTKYNITDANMKLFGAAAMSLALTVNRLASKIDYWHQISGDSDTITNYTSRYTTMLIDVMAAAGGIISTLTYWDYAKSKEELLPLLRDIIACDYNPNVIRSMSDRNITNKCIKVVDFLTIEDISYLTSDYTLPIRNLSMISPCVLNLDQNEFVVEAIWDIDRFKDAYYSDLISVLLHNRDVLYRLSVDTAIRIFEYLTAEKRINDPLVELVLDTICKFSWRETGYRAIVLDNAFLLNPFNTNDEDIIDAEAEGQEDELVLSDEEEGEGDEPIIEEEEDVPTDNTPVIEEEEDVPVIVKKNIPIDDTSIVEEEEINTPMIRKISSTKPSYGTRSGSYAEELFPVNRRVASIKPLYSTRSGSYAEELFPINRRVPSTQEYSARPYGMSSRGNTVLPSSNSSVYVPRRSVSTLI